MIKRKSFCVVCIANYCRSPVFEALLRLKYKDKYEFYSAGLSPIERATMDPRSISFLESKGVKDILHNPKKINKKMLNYFNFFIAVDIFVLNELNKIYPKYRHKFVLATSQIDNIELRDPYRMDNNDYKKIMESIKIVSESIKLDKF